MNIEIETLTIMEQADMIVRGIEIKIEEMFANAEQSKKTGNLRAWANYLKAAADWADKLVKFEIEINTKKARL